jgi:LysM repeat protein
MPKIPQQGEVFIEKDFSGRPGFFRIFKMTPQGRQAYFQDNPYAGQGGEKRTAGFYQPSTGKIFQSGVYTEFIDSGQTLDTTPKKYNIADVGQWEREQGLVPSQVQTERQLAEKKTPPLGGAATQPTTHEVKAGETLSQIGQRYGVDWRQITGYRSGDPNLIYPGETLNIPTTAPTGAGVPPTGVSEAPTGQIGDTGIKPEGMPDDIWNMLSENERYFWTPLWAYLQQQQEAGKEIPPVLNTAELAKL